MTVYEDLINKYNNGISIIHKLVIEIGIIPHIDALIDTANEFIKEARELTLEEANKKI